MRELLVGLMKLLPNKLFYFIIFIYKLKYVPNFKNPKSLNEKLNFIKLNKTNYDLRCLVVDRIKVRDYVLQKTSECTLINNLWVGVNFENDIWKSLPNKFVIKANHGSGMVRVIDKNKDTFEETQSLCEIWLKKDYASRGREWFYLNLEKIIIVEEFIEFNNDVPPDYKFFCMNGRVEMIQVDLDRFKGHVRNLYDRDFNRIQGSLYYPQGYDIEAPIMLEKAIKISECLAQDFDFIRVDLYLLEDKIYFGELTNIPGNGIEIFKPKSLDFKLGDKLELSN